MNYIKTELEGVYVLEPKVFNDARGYFFEAWRKEDFEAHVGKVDFIQDNESKSTYGVLRGLHYQKGEYSQAKLSEENKRQLFIPRGFAHGFLVLSEEAVFTYKVDNVYAPQYEASIRWNDEALALKWPIDPKDVLTSEKDLQAKILSEADLFE